MSVGSTAKSTRDPFSAHSNKRVLAIDYYNKCCAAI